MRRRVISHIESVTIAVAIAATLVAAPATPAHAVLGNPSITVDVGCAGARATIQVNWLSSDELNVYWEIKDTAGDGKFPVLRLYAHNASGNDYYTFGNGTEHLKVTGGLNDQSAGHIWNWNPSIGHVLALRVFVKNGLEDQGTSCEQTKAIKNLAKNAYRHATTRIGSPYIFGEEGPDTFDCSGLVHWSYLQVANFPDWNGHRSSLSMYNWLNDMASDNGGTPWQELDAIRVPAADLQVGDLIFYNQPWNSGTVDHVSFYAGDGKTLDAQRVPGVSRHAENLGEHVVARFRIVGVAVV